MKSIILSVLILVSWYISSCAQNSKTKSNNLIFPVFLDSASFIKEVKEDKRFKDVYENLKKDNDHVTYKYGFNISPSGKIISTDLESDTLFNSINFIHKKHL